MHVRPRTWCFTEVPAGSVLCEFCPLSVDDISSVRQLSNNSSAADPIPTYVLEQVIDLVAPFVADLFNRSSSTGHFLYAGSRTHSFTPIVKKAELDHTDASSCRPISNLPVLSKLLERLVVRQIMEYLTSAELFPPLQSGIRPGHSPKTAILLVMSDTYWLSTVEILLHWCSWTCRQHPTRSITRSFFSGYSREVTASTVQYLIGSNRIY